MRNLPHHFKKTSFYAGFALSYVEEMALFWYTIKINLASKTETETKNMADENSQNPTPTDAPMPDWLKNAQSLAAHEEKAPEVSGGAQPAGDQTAAAQTVATQTAATQTAQPAQTSAAPVSAEPVADAQAPDWLKKAAEKVNEPEAVAEAEPVVSEPAKVEPVKAEAPLPEPKEETPAVPAVLPAWLQKIQKTLEPAVKTDEPVKEAPPAPEGLLETRQVEPAKPAAVGPEQAIAANQTAEKPAAPVAANAQEKKDMFKSVEKSFLSFLGKSKDVVQKSQTAGAPKTEAVPAEPAVESKPETADAAKTAAKTDAGAKASAAKTTADERKALIDAEKIYQQGIATIRDLIAPSSMEIRYDMIRIEGMYAQSFYVFAYPRYLDTNWLSPIVNFDVTMDISQFIYPIESATIMRVLKKKVAQMQASVRINAEKGLVSDPALETALGDAEELRTSIQRGQEKFFQFALYFTIYSEDEKKISKVAKQLESILGGKLILTKKAELQTEHAFNSCLPMCLDGLEVNLNMNTSPLSSTFPFSSSDLTSNEGILYGLNRHNDSLIIFDRFSLENANSVVFAKSGAGKSYCVKLEILRSMMVGADVIVIDPENEYEALAQTVGGSYLKVSLTSDRRINPFDLPSPLEGEDTQPGDLLRQNIINLHGLLKIMLGGVTPSEEGILDKALNDVYSLKGITMEAVDPSSIPPPTMEDLYDILSTMEGGQSLAQRLQKYTVGTYSGIFNKPTNVNLESGLMVFSIRDLEDALRPTAMYIILNYIWNRVRSKLKRRLLVIDEAWTMMQHDDSAKFLFGLVKRARKYYLGITTITQDVEDFVKSPYGKPVVTNSSMQLLLKQAPAAIDVLSKVFNLTEGEKYMLLNSGVGQGLFFAGLKHVAIQIIASYTEDKIVTTNPEEILKGRQSADVYES